MSGCKPSEFAKIPGAKLVDPAVVEAFSASIEEHVIAPLVKDLPKQQAALEEARRWVLW
jgi:hypothetical protein